MQCHDALRGTLDTAQFLNYIATTYIEIYGPSELESETLGICWAKTVICGQFLNYNIEPCRLKGHHMVSRGSWPLANLDGDRIAFPIPSESSWWRACIFASPIHLLTCSRKPIIIYSVKINGRCSLEAAKMVCWSTQRRFSPLSVTQRLRWQWRTKIFLSVSNSNQLTINITSHHCNLSLMWLVLDCFLRDLTSLLSEG